MRALWFCLVLGSASCRSNQAPPVAAVAQHPTHPAVTVVEPSPALERAEPWATQIEQGLQDRARQLPVGWRLEAVRCRRLECALVLRGNGARVEPTLAAWLKTHWTYRWRQEPTEQRATVVITLYRHPADRNAEEAPAYSSLSGKAVPACQRGADCAHPNWAKPVMCEHNASECPAVEVEGKLLCFDSYAVACDCLRAHHVEPPNCNEEGIPY